MKNKAIGFLLLSAVMAFAQGPGGFVRPGGPGGGRSAFGRGGPGGERVVAGAPFSAVEVRQFTEQLATGNSINRTSQTTLYRDSLGRTRSEVTVTPDASTGKQPYTMIVISDPVAGVRHVLDSSTMTSHSSRIPMARAGSTGGGRGNPQARSATPSATGTAASAVRPGRGGAAITRTELGSQVKNGVLAAGTRETEVIPAGSRMGNAQAMTVVRETWYSTELKRAVEIKISDPQRGNSTTELTNLIQGEPSASLFSVPSGYTEKAGGRGAFARGGPGARQ
jgi:hypothetical protein